MYDKAACDGHIESMNALGSLYFNELPPQYDEAAKWFERAAEKGFTRAITNLGICHEFGAGVDKDWNSALKLYLQASEKGHVQGMYNAGYLYFQMGMSSIEQYGPGFRENMKTNP